MYQNIIMLKPFLKEIWYICKHYIVHPPGRNNQINSRFCRTINHCESLDSTYYKWGNLENRVLVDMYHINILKLAFVTTLSSTVTTKGLLEKSHCCIEYTYNISNKIKYLQKLMTWNYYNPNTLIFLPSPFRRQGMDHIETWVKMPCNNHEDQILDV